MQCNRLIFLVKNWYMKVQEEAMAPARMVPPSKMLKAKVPRAPGEEDLEEDFSDNADGEDEDADTGEDELDDDDDGDDEDGDDDEEDEEDSDFDPDLIDDDDEI